MFGIFSKKLPFEDRLQFIKGLTDQIEQKNNLDTLTKHFSILQEKLKELGISKKMQNKIGQEAGLAVATYFRMGDSKRNEICDDIHMRIENNLYKFRGYDKAIALTLSYLFHCMSNIMLEANRGKYGS